MDDHSRSHDSGPAIEAGAGHATTGTDTVPAWFDAAFYQAQNPDVAGGANAAWRHFRSDGWREFRNPSAGFDLWWYQAAHLEGDHRRDPVAHYLGSGHAAGLETTLASGERLDVARKTQFNLRTLALLDGLQASGAVFARIAGNLAQLRLWDVADMFAVRACELQPEVAAHHALLGAIVAKRNGWRRVVTAMRAATTLEDGRADWFQALGLACERLGWLDDAAGAYASALALDGGDADTHYRLGRVEEQRGRIDAAEACYARVMATDPEVAMLGIGLRHEREKDWAGAERAYRLRLADPTHAANARLHSAHGYLLETLYRWEEAADAYANALALEPEQAGWHYRRGWMLERLERPAEAAMAYACALACREDADWRYRQGTCLHAAGETDAAIDAWLRCVPEELRFAPPSGVDDAARRNALLGDLQARTTDPHLHFELGLACERLGLHAEAAAAYRAGIDRHDAHAPRWSFRLGVVLHRAGLGAEACHAFLATRLFRRDFDIVPEAPAVEGQAAPTRDIKLEYAEFIETLPVRDEVVLYESFHGDSVSCNPLAVFRAARERLAGRGLLHVWAVKPHAAIPEDLAAMPDVVFVQHGSPLYARYLATAGWLVNNNTFMPYFVRRPEQRYLNTWHGTPLKKLGIDIPGALFDHKNALRNLLQATHVAMPNAFTRKTLLASMQVEDVIGARIADTGQARIDLMLGADAEARARLKARLGLAADAKVILYAPTWRGSLDGASLDAALVSEAIARLAGHGARVLFSGHHMVARTLGPLPDGAMAVPAGMDITELMSVVDVLVTDYSSILFDFLPSGRPVLLYVPDLEQYRRERGLYLDPASLPVQACATPDALEQALVAALGGAAVTGAAVEAARRDYWPLEDGGSAARTVAFFFEDNTRHVVPRAPRSKRTLLFQVGNFSPNGVTASFNRLAGSLDPSRVSVTVTVDPWTLESYPQRLERFAELPAHVARWGRISYPVANREQQWLSARQGGREVLNARQLRLLDTYYVREYARQFGSADFDVVVDFSGYAAFWTALFARGRPAGTRCAVYLHNDMDQELRSRHPQLAKVFEQYPLCDALVSVSDSLDAVNRRRFAGAPGQQPDRFHSVENCIDPGFIRARAGQELPPGLARWREGHMLLGTVGRLSPEKGHRRLLDAFARVRRAHPAARLVIVGEGPERPVLQQRIAELGLEEDVLLTGALANPYPLMRELDLFVLSSHYEGQGIVLLEALTLGRPVLSTDIPGPQSVLADGAGQLVADSTDGLAEGMCAWLDRPQAGPAWDADGYSRRALARFERAVAGID
ncbi:CDP-glycerol glycerophosphotransferase family protein [Pseudoxanthomonas daejeonensis]|uniref:CDP-glycerol glycerophosphotransferase family protein n=1 Tax=Pseudoxanthomonas daejeonensis TaxID=266062 RepID=UPI001F53EEB0|nr:CDP-glycerol glycerophosphotransferase family protein [Pseudoxanthomonas daejeonensis]UNK57281.1 CDP-glycerol glycerophosphotransferase family protein [Pseudoxanthomonas daejeonensis]